MDLSVFGLSGAHQTLRVFASGEDVAARVSGLEILE